MRTKDKAARPRAASPVDAAKEPQGRASDRKRPSLARVSAERGHQTLAEEAIRGRAYQLWLQDPSRSAQDNWIQAEKELRVAASGVAGAIGGPSADS